MKFEPGQTTAREGVLGTGDKRRLAFLIGGFVVTAAILATTLNQALQDTEVTEATPVVDESVMTEPLLAVPELDLVRLETLIRETEPADQVVLDSDAADMTLAAARRYTRRHFQELAAPELNAEVIANLGNDPSAARGKPFTARGRIVGLRRRTGMPHEDQFLGRLELADGSTAHFLVLSVPEHADKIGGFVRVDGLFLKIYSTEDELSPGVWNAGPLLVGVQAERSYPSSKTTTKLDLSQFDDLVDANLAPDPGAEAVLVSETPPEPFWHMMAFARDLPADSLDWQQAPELDQRLIDQLLEDPASFRGLPVRIPISRLQDGRVRLAGENSARMERYMQGWIGNTTWKNVIQFRSPDLHPEFMIADLVYGQGFFLHNFSYQSSGRGLRVAPVFVLQKVVRHIPTPSKTLMRVPWVIGGIGLFLGVLFVILTKRDRRKSNEFYEEIVRRRRQRRRGKGSVGTAAP